MDNHHAPTDIYPLNPNSSPFGITSLTTTDGRVTIIMPHPDEARQRGDGEPHSGEAEGRASRVPFGRNRAQRVHRTVQMSWHPETWGEDSPWMRMFENARTWVS